MLNTPEENLLAGIVGAIVDHPDSVTLVRTTDDMGVLLTLGLHTEDMGKIIGKEGNTAKAIRTLLRVVGMKNSARVNLKILEPEGSTHRKEPETLQDLETAIADL